MAAKNFAGEYICGFIMFHDKCIYNVYAPSLLIEMFDGREKGDQWNSNSIANGDHNQIYISGWTNLCDGYAILTGHRENVRLRVYENG